MRNITSIAKGSLSTGTLDTTATLTAAQSAPSTANDGVDCDGMSHVAVSIHSLSAVTAWTVEIWVYDGENWVQADDGTGSSEAALSGTNKTRGETYQVAGFKRVMARLSSLTGTSLEISTRVFGPGV